MKALKSKSKKKCRFCRRIFIPDPRVGGRQIACKSKHCRKRSKRVSQKSWCRANPDYFHGRYVELRLWREKNPGYQKRWRRGRSEIQDERLVKRPIKSIRLMLPTCILNTEIQDEITLKHKYNRNVTAVFVHEIQDEI